MKIYRNVNIFDNALKCKVTHCDSGDAREIACHQYILVIARTLRKNYKVSKLNHSRDLLFDEKFAIREKGDSLMDCMKNEFKKKISFVNFPKKKKKNFRVSKLGTTIVSSLEIVVWEGVYFSK